MNRTQAVLDKQYRRYKNTLASAIASLLLVHSGATLSCYAETLPPNAPANIEGVPRQILKSGVNLKSEQISGNSRQLADMLKLTPVLQRIQSLRPTIDPTDFEPTLENACTSAQLNGSIVKANSIIQEASLAVDFVLAEISAEQNIYGSVLSTYTSNRDKAALRTNAVSFIANGALWAIGEAYDIPTNTHPNFSVTSGVLGVLAGIIPSVGSCYALYQLRGRRANSERQPNMLSKIFSYPIVNNEVEYPAPVWEFLNAVPSEEKDAKTRKDLLIERWISDKNIPEFTSKSTRRDLDIITANASHYHGLNISSLNIRLTMLQQLSAEVLKMKRLLLELSMVVQGEKQI